MATPIFLVPTTTSILATVTQAVAERITVTATPAPSITQFGWAFSGAVGFMNVGLFLFCLLVIVILGEFNRLIAVPLIATASNGIAAGCGWYAWESGPNDEYSYSRRVACVLCEVFYKIPTLMINIYSFFLLEKILVGRQRRLFLWVFIPMYIILAAFLFSTVPIVLRFMTHPEEKDLIKNGHLLDKLDYGDYVTKAALEAWCAIFLLRTFYRARKRSRAIGGHTSLFTALLRSSELRVSSLLILAILKIVSYRTQDDVGVVLSGMGQFEFVMINLFPVIFLLDIMAARIRKLQASMESVVGRGPADYNVDSTPHSDGAVTAVGTNCNSANVSGRFLGDPTGKGPVDSLRKDSLRKEYSHYGMATWGRNGSIPTAWRQSSVAEVPEGVQVTEISIDPVSSDSDLEKALGGQKSREGLGT